MNAIQRYEELLEGRGRVRVIVAPENLRDFAPQLPEHRPEILAHVDQRVIIIRRWGSEYEVYEVIPRTGGTPIELYPL